MMNKTKYEMMIKVAQIQRLVEERKYKKAAALLKTVDVRQVKNMADLHTFAEIYMKTEQFDAAKATYLRIYKRSHTRRVLYRLIYLALRTNALEEAETYYQEFVSISSSTRDNIILRYRIDKAKGVPISQLIESLEKLKEEEYIEEWAYELAKLYEQAGREQDCCQECEDIKLWFGGGEIVERANQLLEHIQNGESLVFYDTKDYTQKAKEAPNPDDTGSLPDLDYEILKQEKKEGKKQKKQEKIQREKEKDALEMKKMQAEMAAEVNEFLEEEETSAEENTPEKEKTSEENETSQEDAPAKPNESKLKRLAKMFSLSNLLPVDDDDDDAFYEEVHDDDESIEIKLVEPASKDTSKTKPEEKPEIKRKKITDSSTGITQNLAREIAAIVEAEKNGQLKEKSIAVKNEAKAVAETVASNVAQTVAQKAQKKRDKRYFYVEMPPEAPTEGMEEITLPNQGQQEMIRVELDDDEEVTMIDLDKIMPEPDLPETSQVLPSPQDSPELHPEQELEDKDLPTTRALQKSFQTMLTLIGGELEPTHFVLLGEGEEKIVGVTKKIVQVMYKKGFLSSTQIAKIGAKQLNSMDLMGVARQIKGNCLLIEKASALTLPTITKIFTLMDSFKGDFVVVLADEGSTLDKLFQCAPAMARRFEYIIDVSKYTESEYL